jgi:hypothetical protein
MRKTTLIVLAVTLSIISSGCNSEPSTPEVIDPVASNSEPSTPELSAEDQYSLGYQYYFGEEAVPQDYKEAMKWCRLAADKGNADAMWLIGILYGSGLGVPLDDQEGLKWSKGWCIRT